MYYEYMIVALLALLGLLLGSFVNALVWRLHEGMDWVKGRSECPHCHHKLASKDLVPVLSWLSLGGRCRYCHKPIPDSPLVELALPVLFLISYTAWPLPLQGLGLYEFIFWLIFLVAFLALAVYDLRWYLLPDVIVFPIIGLAAIQVLGSWIWFDHSWQAIVGPLLGAALLSGIFALLHFISKGKWIGFGDVKLAIALGLLAGSMAHALLLLFIACIIGSIIAVPLIVMGKAGRKSHLPFGPLLLAGMVVVQLWGTAIVTWYVNLLA